MICSKRHLHISPSCKQHKADAVIVHFIHQLCYQLFGLFKPLGLLSSASMLLLTSSATITSTPFRFTLSVTPGLCRLADATTINANAIETIINFTGKLYSRIIFYQRCYQLGIANFFLHFFFPANAHINSSTSNGMLPSPIRNCICSNLKFNVELLLLFMIIKLQVNREKSIPIKNLAILLFDFIQHTLSCNG